MFLKKKELPLKPSIQNTFFVSTHKPLQKEIICCNNIDKNSVGLKAYGICFQIHIQLRQKTIKHFILKFLHV